MTNEDIAKSILEELSQVIQINYNFEEMYLSAILKGLEKGPSARTE